MENRMLMKCKNCGAPIIYDAGAGAYSCPFCGQTIAYEGEGGVQEEKLVLRHDPVPMKDGCFDFRGAGEKYMLYGLDKKVSFETWEIKENESYVGFRKPGTIDPREEVEFICKFCGALVKGYGSQNIWTCDYCGNKYAREVLAREGWFKPNWGFRGSRIDENGRIVSINDSYIKLPKYAADFRITREYAKHQILKLVSEHPKAFAEVDMNRHVENLRAVYFNYYLCDSTILVYLTMPKGNVHVLRDAVNWPVPASGNHGEELLQDLAPWDFTALKPFSPAFCEGDVWLDRPWGNDDSPTAGRQRADIDTDVRNFAKKLYSSEEASLVWVRSLDRAKTRIYLPAFYLGRTEKGPKFCFAVNGQTGAVSCLGRGKSAGKHTLVLPGRGDYVSTTSEPTIISEFYPVKEEGKGSELYRVVSPEEAYEKKSFFTRFKSKHL